MTCSDALQPPGSGSTGVMSLPVRVGVLVPWANRVVEAELPVLCPPGVVWHYARLVPSSRRTALQHEFLDGLRAAVPAAVESLGRLSLAAVLMACTSAGFTASQNSLGVVSAFEALTRELARLDAQRIALATPYPRPITQLEVEAFTHQGLTVRGHVSLGLDDGYPDVTEGQLDALVARLDPEVLGESDALVLSCTGWPTLRHIARLERALHIPVLSSNLAMAAYAATLLPSEVGR